MGNFQNKYAKNYDLFYRDKDYKEEALYILSLVKKFKIPRNCLLELGCGTGSHSKILSKHFKNIHGIDISKEMIEIALKDNKFDNIVFEYGDVRDFNLSKTFDCIISLFHVASYQVNNIDISQMFERVSYHLYSGGYFIFDFWYGPGVLDDLPEKRVKKITRGDIKVTRTAKPIMRREQNIVDVQYDFSVNDSNKIEIDSYSEVHSMRYFFLPELKILLEQHNLEFTDAFSWMTLKN